MKNKVARISRRLFQHELISGSSYLFLGSMIVNVFSFLFNFFVVRRLTPVDYGIYASLLSLYSLLVLIPQSFSTTIIQFATEYFSKDDIDKARKLYKQATIFLSILGIIIFFGMLFASPLISAFLHVKNVWLIVGIGVLIFFNYIAVINGSYLQSMLEFKFVSIITVFGAVIKLLSGAALIIMGFGILGAIGAIFMSMVIPFLFTFTRLKFLFHPQKKNVAVPIWNIVKYALPSVVTVIALSSFVSTDVILAKHFLVGSQAGIYAGISLVGKVIFYFTSIIPGVMFPILIRKHTKGHAVHSTFYLGLLLVAIPSFFLTGFYFLFPHFVLTIFLGGRQYLQAVGDIGFMALFLAMFSILSIMVNFFLSLKQTKIVFPVVAMALLQVVCITFFHQTILAIITVSLCVSMVLIFILALYYLYNHTVAKTYTMTMSIPEEL